MERRHRVYAHLEGIELGISLKGQLLFNPLPRAHVLVVQAHNEHRVDGVNHSVPNASRFSQVGSPAANRMILVRAHGVPLWLNQSRFQRGDRK